MQNAAGSLRLHFLITLPAFHINFQKRKNRPSFFKGARSAI